MKYNNCYISSNSNQTPTAVDWGRNNKIIYGSCNSILIYNPNYGSGGKITHSLVGHSKRVNSVKWIKSVDVDYETELVSGSSDNTVRVWSFKNESYKCITLEGHDSNVNIVDGIYQHNDKKHAVVVSVSMDCTIKIWNRINLEDSHFKLCQSISFGYHIAVALRLTVLPNTNALLLATGLDNSKIYIYDEEECDSLKFKERNQLSGHEDWVRGLDFTVKDDDLLLASCSQDAFIRLWRLTTKPVNSKSETLADTVYKQSTNYEVSLESVLIGHEGWIYSVNWSSDGQQILSASIDKSMVIWEHDNETNLWLEKIRVGEVGGNTLGFYGGIFSPDGKTILGHNYHGSFHIWKLSEDTGKWLPGVTLGGHFQEVVDCAWEPKGEFLFSCGTDQTTRIHAPWKAKDKDVTWHEIARPQVHGYDMSSIAIISRYEFASGAEEKVIRVFQAPDNFIENFKRICNISDKCEDVIKNEMWSGPKGASVPSLGLSNKAVYVNDNIDQAAIGNYGYSEESHFTATAMNEPPTEETLLQNTLWPEIQKLYGHGYEIYCLAASPDAKYLASACKSTKLEHAAILLWDTSNWHQVQKLVSHSLTVVQLEFSPDSENLLSVSRDRRWSLFNKNGEKFELVATTEKTTGVHSRIIWCCSWSHDSKYFATGSRDGKLVIWTRSKFKETNSVLGDVKVVSKPIEFKNESVTAVSFAPNLIHEKCLIAVGLESGRIHLFLWSPEEWKEVLVLSNGEAHHLTVRRLRFRPVFGRAGYKPQEENILQLASCSSDSSVRIYDIFTDRLY